MPTTVIVGLLCLLLALVLYSVGVWTAFRKKGFGRLQVWTLWLGVLFDIIATVSMGWRIGGLDLSTRGLPHTVIALVATLGMIIAAIFGEMAYVKKDEALGAKCAKLNIIPWALWVAVFLWSLATRMPAR